MFFYVIMILNKYLGKLDESFKNPDIQNLFILSQIVIIIEIV